jgi:hypothetical protein
MNTGTAISAAILTGLVAGELQELATPPDKGPSVHAPADSAASAGLHLDYAGFPKTHLVTLTADDPVRSVATLGQVEIINQPPPITTPLLAVGPPV